jgi:hypothetical protein
MPGPFTTLERVRAQRTVLRCSDQHANRLRPTRIAARGGATTRERSKLPRRPGDSRAPVLRGPPPPLLIPEDVSQPGASPDLRPDQADSPLDPWIPRSFTCKCMRDLARSKMQNASHSDTCVSLQGLDANQRRVNHALHQYQPREGGVQGGETPATDSPHGISGEGRIPGVFR